MKSSVCITGATGGLGKAFAVECASRGWALFLTDLSHESLAILAEGLSNTYGVKADFHACDLADQNSRAELFSYMKSSGLRFSWLINVAGLDFEGPFAEKTEEQIRTLTRLNMEANLEMTWAVLKLREGKQPFRIINVASLAAFYPMPLKAMYAASKRFLLDFSIALREELRPYGVTVTVLCPAGMPTNLNCIRAIAAQGFAGTLTTKNVGYVASKAIEHALKGHAVCIPGTLNRALKFLGMLVPPTIAANLIGNRWNLAHARAASTAMAFRNSSVEKVG